MNEDIVKSLNIEFTNLLKSKDSIENQLQAVNELKDKAEMLLGRGSDEQEKLLTACYELLGNLQVQQKKPVEAEKSYKTMREKANKLYKKDRKKYGLLMGQVNLRMGIFYQAHMGLHTILPKPRKLNEKQSELAKLILALYRDAVHAMMDLLKAGDKRAVSIQVKCMANTMLLNGNIGEYEQAVKTGDDLIRLGKLLFEASDDTQHAMELSQNMNQLASFCSLKGDNEKAMELLEDSIYVLEDKEEEAPLAFALPLAASWISLGNVYAVLPNETEKAKAAHEKGLAKLSWLNGQTDGKYQDMERQIRERLAK